MQYFPNLSFVFLLCILWVWQYFTYFLFTQILSVISSMISDFCVILCVMVSSPKYSMASSNVVMMLDFTMKFDPSEFILVFCMRQLCTFTLFPEKPSLNSNKIYFMNHNNLTDLKRELLYIN